jgi:hypothetical protein
MPLLQSTAAEDNIVMELFDTMISIVTFQAA